MCWCNGNTKKAGRLAGFCPRVCGMSSQGCPCVKMAREVLGFVERSVLQRSKGKLKEAVKVQK